jgi:hypothetical protein
MIKDRRLLWERDIQFLSFVCSLLATAESVRFSRKCLRIMDRDRNCWFQYCKKSLLWMIPFSFSFYLVLLKLELFYISIALTHIVIGSRCPPKN